MAGYSTTIETMTLENDSFRAVLYTEPLGLYTVYSPPEHPDGTVHRTKQEAEAYERGRHH